MGTPERIGKYTIQSLLGRGGMGEVYLARDEALGRDVALKIMRGPSLDDAQMRERFIREAQAAGGLRHPNIVTVYDLGDVEGQLYIAMEFIRGQDLDHIIKERLPISIEDRLNIMIQACEGISYAHKNQIVHRDLKPSNIRIDEEGVVKIMDFGIARLESSNMTASGMLLGTPFYMSPEQVRGIRVDARSDIFALGAILYEVFTYEKAFSGEMAAVFYKIVHEEPVPLSNFMQVDASPLQEVVNRCLERDKSRRLQTAGELAGMLRGVLQIYRNQDEHTVTGIKTIDMVPGAVDFHIAPAPTAVHTHRRGATGTAFPPSQTPYPLEPTEQAPSRPAPATQLGSPQPSYAPAPPPPLVAPAPVAAGTPAAKIIAVVLGLLIVLGGSGFGVYYYIRNYTDLLGKKGESPDFQQQLEQGKTLYKSGKYQEAIDVYDALLKEKPDDANLNFLMGAAKQKMLKNQEALAYFQKAVALDSNHAGAWQQIGFLLSDRMDYKNAEAAFKNSLAVQPGNAATLEGLAQVYVSTQKDDQAADTYKRLLAIEPGNERALYNLGVIMANRENYDESRRYFEKVIELNPNYAEAHNNLGTIYQKQGNLDRSIAENERAIQLKPSLASAHFSLYSAYEQKLQYVLAAEHLQEYIRISGDDDPELAEKLRQLQNM